MLVVLNLPVFAGGVGEHAAEVRGQVCEDASWLKVELDDTANAVGGPTIARQRDLGT